MATTPRRDPRQNSRVQPRLEQHRLGELAYMVGRVEEMHRDYRQHVGAYPDLADYLDALAAAMTRRAGQVRAQVSLF
jgi:hypothetical protein